MLVNVNPKEDKNGFCLYLSPPNPFRAKTLKGETDMNQKNLQKYLVHHNSDKRSQSISARAMRTYKKGEGPIQKGFPEEAINVKGGWR